MNESQDVSLEEQVLKSNTPALSEFMKKNITKHKKWKYVLTLAVVLPLFLTEFNDMKNREKGIITGCALNKTDEKTMQTCQDVGVILCQNGLDIDLSSMDKYGDLLPLFLNVIAICAIVELLLFQLRRHEIMLLRFLQYGYYTQTKRRKFILYALVLLFCIIIYISLKYAVFKDLTTNDTVNCNSQKIYVSVNSRYGTSTLSTLVGLLVMFVIFKDALTEQCYIIWNFYQDVTLKEIVEKGSPKLMEEIKNIKCIPLQELEQHFDAFLKTEFSDNESWKREIDFWMANDKLLQKFFVTVMDPMYPTQ